VLHRLEIAGRLYPAPARRGALARQADVLGDLVEPRRLELRVDAALDPAERVQEGRLRCVLGLFAAAQLMQAVRVDLARVPLVEIACRIRFRSGTTRRHLGSATN